MAPPLKGTIHTHSLADGTRAFHLRVRYRGERVRVVLHEVAGCSCGCGGGWDAPTARTELGNIQAKIRVGVWQPPAPEPVELTPAGAEAFAEYADWWIAAKIRGELGARPISKNTEINYRWRLSHLLPFFGPHRLDRIDRDLCQAFKARKLQEAREITEALDAGADLRDQHGRKLRPLNACSLRDIISTLAAILDEAIEDRKIDHNPARGRRMKIYVPKPSRTFLEMDELATLLDAATAAERYEPKPRPAPGPTALLVGGMLARGLRPNQIAKKLGIAKSTVAFHTRRLGVDVGRGYVGRRVVVEILGRAGVRVSELCDMRIGHVRLHDPDGARFRIPDAKTESGIREVQMTPDLVEAVVDHLDRLQRAGRSTGPEDFLVQNLHGGRMDRQRVASIVTQAATAANGQHLARGLPPLPKVTPHSLRRTYISIALLANQFDVKWVMNQVGHADSKMTMDVYAQLEQRVDRSHGTNFDRLIAGARHDGFQRDSRVLGGVPFDLRE
ncbi:MAG: tyrosine-type recombinase/integrase [Patulibacter sp.]|nr:tyrosine-type recombinase/integrase [Patulibacter sp.]